MMRLRLYQFWEDKIRKPFQAKIATLTLFKFTWSRMYGSLINLANNSDLAFKEKGEFWDEVKNNL